MKQRIILTSIAFIALLFSFANFALHQGDSVVSAQKIFHHEFGEIEGGFSSVPLPLQSFALQAESIPNIFNTTTSFVFKNTSVEQAITKISTNHQLAREFVQYTIFSRNFTIRYQRAGIVFPFHFFW